MIYTLIENCRLHGIDPYPYLQDLRTRLPGMTNREVAQQTPLNWLHARQAADKPSRPHPALLPISLLRHRKYINSHL